MTASGRQPRAAAFLIASGIMLSRIAGLVRQRVFAHYFGNSDAADAFSAAFRIPNFLQNLFGEGVLSASFIPVYARLIAEDDEAEAGRVAGAIASILFVVASVLVLGGVLATPWLIDAIAPGFTGEKRDLTIRLVEVLFPGAGLLVMSAWCLGVLNSHRRFFLSYISPVIWNAAMIATLVAFGQSLDRSSLAEALAWGSVVGSGLQFVVQLPVVLRLVQRLRLSLDVRSANVWTVLRNFLPVFIGRGVVQISGYVDTLFASLLQTGAVAGLLYAQTLYILPVSLFGMSVSAAELPTMSSATGNEEEVAAFLRKRLDAGLRKIAFFIVPSAMAFFALGDVIAGALYQSGEFGRDDAVYVWAILAGGTIGLLAITQARLYSSTFYALRDTRTPLVYALVHVTVSAALGWVFAFPVTAALGVEPKWGAAGLTAAARLGGVVEFFLLRRSLNRRIGPTGLPFAYLTRLWASAAVGAALGWTAKLAVGTDRPIVTAIAVLAPYGLGYFAVATLLGVPEVRSALSRLNRLRGGRS